MRLIDADMLKEAIKEYFKSYITDSSCMIDGFDCNADICRIVEEQPTVAGENGFRADAVEITEEMVRDFQDCTKKAEMPGGGKDCDTCSWNRITSGDVCACELEGIKERVAKRGGADEE
ncbi:hypothetical protein [[Ruminococcus] lactaris]|uniref:hypothetical protein n=1 Tax=[Ruminococcus] lactaris TaxID=46228 RepID=UPI0026DCCEBA|nr:hypothetical protein [[Ruminococcus] lactaris]